MMREAILQYVEREEKRESFRRDGMRAWAEYQEIFFSLHEARILIEQWRRHHNTARPHSALGYRPPAPESFITMDRRPTMH